MPKQLIYTSAPRGIVPGQSGYCTVARSAEMREALILRLEQLSYYQHLSLSGGTERPISAYRIVDIRGSLYHVLSKIQDAGLDFTGRTNFIAHHLVFEPKEIGEFPSPPVILRDWLDWKQSWPQEPELLKNEESVWSKIKGLAGKTNGEAKTWRDVTGGHAENGYGLLDALRGTSFRVGDGQTDKDEKILGLFAESLELLEVRREDFRNAAWDFTFTTSMQEQDNPADFRWRCIHSDNPAINALTAVPLLPWTDKDKEKEEKAFASQGRKKPQTVKLTSDDLNIREGAEVRLEVETDGIPAPTIQWFEIEFGKRKEMDGQSGTKITLNPEGRAKRYQVQANNSSGSADSNVVEITIRPIMRVPTLQPQSDDGSRATANPVPYNVDYQEKKERQLRRLEAEKEQKAIQERLWRNKILVRILTIVLLASALAAVIVLRGRKPPSIISQPTIQTNQDGSICINVAAGGKPPLTFDWYKNDHPFSTSTNSILTLEKTASSNSATFFVIISNSIASAKSIDVQWQGIPAPVPPPTPTASSNQPTSTQSAEGKSGSGESKPQAERTNNFPPPTEFDLPDGWTQIPIGDVPNHHADYINVKTPAEFVLTAEAAGFFTNGDHFFFVYETNAGKEFQAIISKIDPQSTLSRCGIMVRASTNFDSPFLFIGVSIQKIIAYRRDSKGQMFTNEVARSNNKQGVPVIVKFDQKDNQFVPAYWNSESWSSFQDCAIPKNEQMLVGFALYSGSSSAKVTAHFVNGAPKNDSAKKK